MSSTSKSFLHCSADNNIVFVLTRSNLRARRNLWGGANGGERQWAVLVFGTIGIDRTKYGRIDVCARTNDAPEEGGVVHSLGNEMALALELSFESVECMLLAGCEVAQSAWERLVIGVGDAFGQGTGAGRFKEGHGRCGK